MTLCNLCRWTCLEVGDDPTTHSMLQLWKKRNTSGRSSSSLPLIVGEGADWRCLWEQRSPLPETTMVCFNDWLGMEAGGTPNLQWGPSIKCFANDSCNYERCIGTPSWRVPICFEHHVMAAFCQFPRLLSDPVSESCPCIVDSSCSTKRPNIYKYIMWTFAEEHRQTQRPVCLFFSWGWCPPPADKMMRFWSDWLDIGTEGDVRPLADKGRRSLIRQCWHMFPKYISL